MCFIFMWDKDSENRVHKQNKKRENDDYTKKRGLHRLILHNAISLSRQRHSRLSSYFDCAEVHPMFDVVRDTKTEMHPILERSSMFE